MNNLTVGIAISIGEGKTGGYKADGKSLLAGRYDVTVIIFDSSVHIS